MLFILYHIHEGVCDIIVSVNEIIVVIPAFEPDSHLPQLVRRLKPVFHRLIVVDDGSRSASTVFADLRSLDGVTVLVHGENRGKGAALKTAFAEVRRRFPDAPGVITVDADGQHLPEDILRVAQSLAENPDRITLGVRTFGRGIPFRSKFGNLWTLGEFRLLTGHSIRDTQSGLRGIPCKLLPQLLEIPGDRYDYEIRMLVRAVRQTGGIIQLPITTVYENNNATSHFKPLADTLNTQRALIAEAITARCGSQSRA